MTDTSEGFAEFNFDDLTPQSVPVRYQGSKYILHEADADAAAKFRNLALRNIKLTKDGSIDSDLGGMADLEPYLVSLCLYEIVEGKQAAHPVPLAVIRSWPSRIIKPLFMWVKENSGLDEKDTRDALLKKRAEIDKLLEKEPPLPIEDELKNSQIATKASS